MEKYTSYVIKDGDTLQLISQNLLNDASRFYELAIFNDLDYPFIVPLSESPVNGTLTTGGTLYIPVSTDISSITDSEKISGLELFGSDLILNTNNSLGGGELVVNSQSDLHTIQGLDCLLQDLINRLFTVKGTLLYHPNYGSNFSAIVGNKNDVDWKQKAIIELTQIFRSDPRVKDVINIRLDNSIPTAILLRCDIVTLGGGNLLLSTAV